MPPPHKHTNYQAPALIWSAVMHLMILLLVMVGLPSIWEKHRESLPTAISVEVLPITELTNIKRKQAQKKEKTKKEEAAKAKKAKSASSSNQEAKKEKKKAIAPPKPKEKKKPKKKEKPKEKPKPKKKKKEKKSDLDSILKSIEDAAKKEEGDKPKKSKKEVKKAISDTYNPALPMGMSEIDAIRSQFIKCWNMPAGARNAHELRIIVDVRLRANGSVISAELAEEKGRYYQDGFFRAAADSAVRAVYRCSPIKGLPANKYETWKYIQLTFDPRDALY
ncbi:MAG: hypothetical protein P8P30_09800 [Rickettsiales bacterium]|nr:hypothetical protein [Rickettsiales bacterium]